MSEEPDETNAGVFARIRPLAGWVLLLIAVLACVRLTLWLR